MDYSLFKFIHIVSMLMTSIFLSHLYFGHPHQRKILRGLLITFFLSLIISGLFLMGEIGFNFYDFFPFWIKAKIGIWILIFVVGTIAEEKIKNLRSLFFYFLSTLSIIAILFSIYHPSNLKKLEKSIRNTVVLSLTP